MSLPPGISLPSCGETLCHSRGSCTPSPDRDEVTVCDCLIGYTGEFCEDTVNKSISMPLTISVLIVIIITVVLAFLCAFAWQKRQLRRRQAWAVEKEGLSSRVVCVNAGGTSRQEFAEKLSP